MQSVRRYINKQDDPLVITNTDLDDLKILAINPAWSKMTGYTEEDVLGLSPKILQGPKTNRSVIDHLKSTLRGGFRFEGDTWNYGKDGKLYRVAWAIDKIYVRGNSYYISLQLEVKSDEELKMLSRKAVRHIIKIIDYIIEEEEK